MGSWIFKLLTILALPHYVYCMQGTMTQFTLSGAMQQKSHIFWYLDEKQYTPGLDPQGVTFYFPDNLFTTTPTICLALHKEDCTSDCLAEPIVVYSTTTSARVLVTVENVSTVTEADNTFSVAMYAMGS